MIIDSNKKFSLQKERINHKFRNFSKEKMKKKIGKLNFLKKGFNFKLKNENNDPFRMWERSESQPNNRNNQGASIFNVTFGNMKFTPKQDQNLPLFCKGKNFNSEGILPPNFGLEDVFLKYELNKKRKNSNNNQGTIMSRNHALDPRKSNNNSLYVRYFHTSDGARKNNAYSLEPYRDSQPYLQQNEGNSASRSF